MQVANCAGTCLPKVGNAIEKLPAEDRETEPTAFGQVSFHTSGRKDPDLTEQERTPSGAYKQLPSTDCKHWPNLQFPSTPSARVL